jgi:hypothetical protein
MAKQDRQQQDGPKRGRPVGSGKPPGEKYILKAFKFPPDLWQAFSDAVPSSERSATIRRYVEQEVKKRQRGGAVNLS